MNQRLLHIARVLLNRPRPTRKEPSPFMSLNDRYAVHDIGEWTYGAPRIHSWDDGTKLRVGKFCSFALNVTIILGGEHRTDWVTTYPFNTFFPEAKDFKGHPHSKGDIVIGNDVWIGYGAILLSGITIGDGAAIGAGSVVTKDVAPYSVVAGNPAQQVKLRFPEPTIEKLLQIAWWDWPMSKIQEAWPLLMAPTINEFIEKYGSSLKQPSV